MDTMESGRQGQKWDVTAVEELKPWKRCMFGCLVGLDYLTKTHIFESLTQTLIMTVLFPTRTKYKSSV